MRRPCLQVERLQELEARLEELGIGRGSALQLEQTKTPNGYATLLGVGIL